MSNENYKIMYGHAINSNIKLVDENKFLKLENEELSNIIYEYEKWLIERVSDGSNMDENHIYVISLKKLQELIKKVNE